MNCYIHALFMLGSWQDCSKPLSQQSNLAMEHFLRFLHLGKYLAAFLLLGQVARAQAPAWQSAVAIGDDSDIAATTTDASGNVYLAGSFRGTATFGSTVLTNSGGTDVFIAKWSPATNSFVWAQQGGGSSLSGAFASSIAVAGNSIYLAGEYGGTPSLGSFTLPSPGTGYNDIFIAKLTATSTGASFTWVQTGSGSGYEAASALAVVGSSVYVAGSFDGSTASFGATTLTNPNIGGPTPGGGGTSSIADIFVAKMVDAGSSAAFSGALRVGGSRDERAVALVANGNNLYLAGRSTSVPLTFEGFPAGSSGGPSVFVAKLTDASPMGAFVWVQGFGGYTYSDAIGDLAVVGNNIYVTGAFSGPSITAGGILLPNNSPAPYTTDLYLAKITDAGASSSFAWARGLSSSPGNKAGQALAVNGADVYVAGTFSNVANFGNTALSSEGYQDVFVAKFTDTGTAAPLVWAQQAGGTRSDYAVALAVGGSQVCVGGTFQWPAASFGNISVAMANSVGVQSAFWAALPTNAILAASPASSPAEVALFPNPARTSATLRLPAVAQARAVQVFDALGREVAHQLVPAHTTATTLNVSSLAAGVYIVRCGEVAARLAIQ